MNPSETLLRKSAFGLYIFMIILLAIATFVEKYRGTPFAESHIYHTIWFVILWVFVSLPALWYLILKRVYKRKAVFTLHLSFFIILAGACITHFTGKQGVVHLRQHEQVNTYLDPDNQETFNLPFILVLDTFYIKHYPGTETPANYVSHIHIQDKDIKAEVSMNNIVSHQGYRFYQSSFDEDGLGSWLSVNHDPWGIAFTYCGYILLLISMLWVLLTPGSGFRKLLNHPALKQTSIVLLLLCCSSLAQAATTLNKEEADKYRGKQVIYHDRVVPLNTLARDFVTKLTGKAQYKDYTPEQVLTGFLFHAEEWQNEPIIRIKSKELQKMLGVGEFACLTDFFTNHKEYRLQRYWDKLHQSGKQSTLLKAITETDEKVALIAMLREGTLIKAIPETGVDRLTKQEVNIELFYNKIPFASLLFKINLTLGAFTFLFFSFRTRRTKQNNKINTVIFCLLLLSFLFHTTNIGLRTYIGGRFPLSNGYETMLFTAWCILLVALLFHKRFPLIMSFGFLLSGFTLLVASLGQMNPQITPLIPVLVSPLLSLHVSCIMMSYALFGFMFLNGLIAIPLSLKKNKSDQIESLTVLSRLLLYPATFLLGIGIFIGAVWANVSWGRYWAWDPKEVWALITFMVYGLAFHVQSIKRFRAPLFFHLFILLAFGTVLMTYFGVNYFLGGMHSYA